MAQTTRFTITTDFSDEEEAAVPGRSTARTAMLDALFSALQVTLNGEADSLSLIQHDDTPLLEGIVKPHTVASEALTYFKTAGSGALRGQWLAATAYNIKDVVSNGAQSYVCFVAHTSAALFATDVAAGKWGFLLQSANQRAAGFSFTPSGGVVSKNVQSVIGELKSKSLLKAKNLSDLPDMQKARETLRILQSHMIALSNESAQITTGTKVTWRVPYAFRLDSVRASLTAAGTTPTIVDINRNGVSVLSTKLMLDASETTSTSAAVPAVISGTDFVADDEITFDIDVAGAGAVGLKVYLLHRTATVASAPVEAPVVLPAALYEGYGKLSTIGEPTRTPYVVTSLANSGNGSLRDAMSQNNRDISFGVSGTINLTGPLVVNGRSNIRILGLAAPAPGITVSNYGIGFDSGSSHIILEGLRSRGSAGDGFSVVLSHHILFNQCSISGFGDGAIDITDDSADVTMQWCILGTGIAAHNLPNLIADNALRVSVHHNIFYNTMLRNPRVAGSFADVRNNLIWEYIHGAMEVDSSATANIIKCYLYPDANAADNPLSEHLRLTTPSNVYTEGIVQLARPPFASLNLNLGTRGTAHAVDAAYIPASTSALQAAHDAVAKAGARGPNFGLDATDLTFINAIKAKLPAL